MSRQTRREFLACTVAGAATMGAGLGMMEPKSYLGVGPDIPRRTLGKTGEKVSAVGIGTAEWGGLPDADVDRMVDWCRHGPELARVDEIEVEIEPVRGEAGFRGTG